MKEIKKINFHGILSLIIFITAIGISSINIFFYSRLFGIIYLSIIPFLFLSVIYFYCSKCPHVEDGSCRHFIFGKIAKIFQNRANEKYNIVDYIGTIIPILGIVAFPQFWLIKNIPLFSLSFLLRRYKAKGNSAINQISPTFPLTNISTAVHREET